MRTGRTRITRTPASWAARRHTHRLDKAMDAQYRFSGDTAEINRERVHGWISEQSYWAPGRSRSRQDAAIDGSRNFGVYDSASNEQVAYARMVTDGVTIAWLCDVFVDPAVRGRGVGAITVRRSSRCRRRRPWVWAQRHEGWNLSRRRTLTHNRSRPG